MLNKDWRGSVFVGTKKGGCVSHLLKPVWGTWSLNRPTPLHTKGPFRHLPVICDDRQCVLSR